MGFQVVDLIGKRFGRLVVVEFLGIGTNRSASWKCSCDCGNTYITTSKNLQRKNTHSCGCYLTEYNKKHKVHGMHHTKTYQAWADMKSRCNNINHHAYKDYGGRGIKVCDNWLSFEGFYKDMGDKPELLSLDRIDNNSGYHKDNCRWTTHTKQCNNTRRNVNIKFNGEIKTLAQWAEEKNINPSTLYDRIYRRNWTIEQALSKHS